MITALLSEVVKIIIKEMKGICSPKHDSILRDCCEGNIIWHYILLIVLINLTLSWTAHSPSG